MRRNDNEIKFNGILFWARNDDWGQKAVTADKKILFTEETAQQSKDLELEPVDFHIEGYIYGSDTQEKVAKLYKAFASKKSGILEHKDIGKVRVKFAEGGFRFKRNEEKYNYYELTLDFKVVADAALNIKIVEVQELKEEQLKTVADTAQKKFLATFNEKFTFEGFPNLIKMQTFDNLTAISGKLSELTADKLIGDVTYPVIGSWDILSASVGGIGAALQSYLDLGGKKKSKYYTYMDVASDKSGIRQTVSGKGQVANNTQAAIDLIRQTALIKACELVEDDVFDTRAEILAAADKLLQTSVDIACIADNKTVQDNLLTTAHLAAVILKRLPAANTRIITRNIMLPATVICYDENCSEEIFIRQNKIRHPLFVPAGVPLEVSDDGN